MPDQESIHGADVHSKIRVDLKRWRSLPLVGIQRCLDPNFVIELRTCTCGSMLGQRVKASRRTS